MYRSTVLRLVLLLISLLLCLLLVSCTTTGGAEAYDSANTLLDYLIADDMDAAEDMVGSSITRDDLVRVREAMEPLIKDCKTFEIKQTGWNSNLSNGLTTTTNTFEVTLDNGNTMIFNTITRSDIEGIAGISFTETTEFTRSTSSFVPVLNGVFTLISLAVMAFTIWMIVDCARRPMAKKVLWIIVILLSFTLTLTLGQQSGVRFGFGLFLGLTSAKANPTALALILKFNLPVGALIYFFRRKRLTLPPPSEPPITEAPAPSDGTFNPPSDDHVSL